VKTKEPERGVRRREAPEPVWRITPRQGRIAFFGALGLLVLSAAWWAYHSPFFTVSNVEVSGASEVPPADIVRASGIDGASVFGLDLAAAEARIEELPKVFDATIEKHGWTSVTITVEERTAWGNWQIDGVNVPIDIDGYVLDGPPAPDGAPTILEVEPKRALNKGDRLDPGAVQLAARIVEESQTAFGRQVLVLAYRQESGLTVALSSTDINGQPIWVTFGDSRDYDYKIASLYVLLEQAKERDLELNAVDLRFGDRLSFN
jgi:hypothetical protein